MSRKKKRNPRPAPPRIAPAPVVRRSGMPRIVPIAGVALAALALIWVVAGKRFVGRTAARPRNILLVTLDTTRPDHLGCYGDRAARTPNIDKIAAEGVRFDRAYSPVPLTLPSHASILTGLYPPGHGIRNNGRALAEGVRTLAEILKARGYASAAFVSSFSLDSRFGLDRGFDVYDDDLGSASPYKTENAERRAEETSARASRWLGQNAGRPFFCWVHFFDPHLPYDPPEPYKDEFRDAPYDGEIAYMDRSVGALRERLEELGHGGDTLIVVAGDHGEGLGDKVEIGHGLFLYEETVRVPLIVRRPGSRPRPRTVDAAVRLVDVAPTILDLASLRSEAAAMSGRSLVPWMDGKGGPGLDALLETAYPRDNFGWSELAGLVSGPWKYIQAPKPELYDLAGDASERSNLFGPSSARAADMRRALERELARAAGAAAAKPGGAAARSEDLDRLRSLGYVNFAPAKPGAAALPDPKDELDSLRLIQRAQDAEFAGNAAEAEALGREIMKTIPDSPGGYVNTAIAQAGQKKFDAAIETLKAGLARIPGSETLLVRLGHTCLVAGKVAAASVAMETVLASNPKNVDALTVRAGILDSTGRKDEAAKYFERALAVEPESRFLRTSYAACLASGGRLREAIAVYDRLIEDDPGQQAYYQYAGIAHSYLGEFDAAISYLKRAVDIHPTASGYFNLAVACEKTGKPDEAVKYLKLYLDNSAGESEANVAKARAELQRLQK